MLFAQVISTTTALAPFSVCQTVTINNVRPGPGKSNSPHPRILRSGVVVHETHVTAEAVDHCTIHCCIITHTVGQNVRVPHTHQVFPLYSTILNEQAALRIENLEYCRDVIFCSGLEQLNMSTTQTMPILYQVYKAAHSW